MHQVISPHCGYCEHFEVCLQVDMVTEWGYCLVKTGDKPPSSQEIEAIKHDVEAGNHDTLLTRGQELGLFIPAYTDCKSFSDMYPF